MGLLKAPVVQKGITVDPETVIGRPGDLVYDSANKTFRGLDGETPGGKVIGGEGPIYARNYGVVGDGVADDTAAVIALHTNALTTNRTVHYGAMRVRITSQIPVLSHSVQFDEVGHAYGAPGFYPDFPAGSTAHYVAVLVYGVCSDLRFGVIGKGDVTVNTGNPATVTGDTRQVITGVQLGTADQPFQIGKSCHIASTNMGATGILRVWVNDGIGGNLATEKCGNVINPGANQIEYYAFDDQGAGGQAVLNHSIDTHIQCELAVGRAYRRQAGSFSNVALQIHSERAVGVPGDAHPERCWYLSGNGIVLLCRLQSFNPALGSTIYGLNTTFVAYRGEGVVTTVQCNVGNYAAFINPDGAVLRPAALSAGRVSVTGGMATIRASAGEAPVYPMPWELNNVEMPVLELGQTADAHGLVINGGSSSDVHPAAGSGACNAIFSGSFIGNLTASPIPGSIINMHGAAEFILPATTADQSADAPRELRFDYCMVRMRGGRIRGSFFANNATLDLTAGEVSQGFRQPPAQGTFASICGPAGRIRGTVANWGTPPATGSMLGAIADGEVTKVFPVGATGSPSAMVFRASDGVWKGISAVLA